MHFKYFAIISTFYINKLSALFNLLERRLPVFSISPDRIPVGFWSTSISLFVRNSMCCKHAESFFLLTVACNILYPVSVVVSFLTLSFRVIFSSHRLTVKVEGFQAFYIYLVLLSQTAFQ